MLPYRADILRWEQAFIESGNADKRGETTGLEQVMEHSNK